MEKKKRWRKRFFEENEWLRYSHYHIKGTLFSRPTFQLSCISLVRASMTLLTSLISLYLLSTRARWLMDIGREQKSGQYRAQLCYNPENWLDFTLRFIHDVPQFFKESSRKKGRIFPCEFQYLTRGYCPLSSISYSHIINKFHIFYFN